MSEWIPVTERLPELIKNFDPEGDDWRDSDFVLVSTEDKKVCEAQYWKINEKYGWVNLSGFDVCVTHWMPLPEPPKEAPNV